MRDATVTPSEVTCPACQATFRVAEDIRDAWLICPRCLGQVPNPRRSTEAAPPPEADRNARPCLECLKDVQLGWRYCPSCGSPVRGGWTLDARLQSIVGAFKVLLAQAGKETDRRWCPACSKPVEAAWDFCPHCGAPQRRQQAMMASLLTLLGVLALAAVLTVLTQWWQTRSTEDLPKPPSPPTQAEKEEP